MKTILKIVIKGTERKKLSEEYDLDSFADAPVTMQKEDPTINKYLKILLDEFKGEPEDIIITTKMILQ
jgi:primosomal protein N'